MKAVGAVLNVTPARMLRLAKRYGIKTGQRGGQSFVRYPSGACLLQFSLEGKKALPSPRHSWRAGAAQPRVGRAGESRTEQVPV